MPRPRINRGNYEKAHDVGEKTGREAMGTCDGSCRGLVPRGLLVW